MARTRAIFADGKTLTSKIARLEKYVEERRKYYDNEEEYLRWAKGVFKGALENFAREVYAIVR